MFVYRDFWYFPFCTWPQSMLLCHKTTGGVQYTTHAPTAYSTDVTRHHGQTHGQPHHSTTDEVQDAFVLPPLRRGEGGGFVYPLLASLFLPHACAFRHIAIMVLSELGVELETKLWTVEISRISNTNPPRFYHSIGDKKKKEDSLEYQMFLIFWWWHSVWREQKVIDWMEPCMHLPIKKLFENLIFAQKTNLIPIFDLPLESLAIPVYSVNMTTGQLNPQTCVPPYYVPISMICAY